MDNVKWEPEAIETIQNLERYTIIKAINESKNLVKRVMETASKSAENGIVTNTYVKTIMSKIINEINDTKKLV